MDSPVPDGSAPGAEVLADLLALLGAHDPVRAPLEDAIRGVLAGLQTRFQTGAGAAVFSTRARVDPRDVLHGWRPVWFCSTASRATERLVQRLARGLRWIPRVDIVPEPFLANAPHAHIVRRDRYPVGSSHRWFAERTGICHRLMLEVHLSDRVNVLVLLDRSDDRPFTEREVARAHAAAHLLVPTATRWAMLLGLQDGVLLSPRERDVQRCLALGMTEDEGADALQLRASSFHQVAVKLYRKRGVTSRGQLLSRLIVPTPTGAEPRVRTLSAGLPDEPSD